LSMREIANGLVGEFEYSTDLFDDETIARMTRQFLVLLEGIVANPDERIGNLALLTQPERKQLIVEWNRTDAPYPRETPLHKLFEAQAELTPDATAVLCGDERLTYGELNRSANQLAHYLQSLGVGPEVMVAVCLERSLRTPIVLLGILKAGGAYLPLDPASPMAYRAQVIEDAQPTVLITRAGLSEWLDEARTSIVRLD